MSAVWGFDPIARPMTHQCTISMVGQRTLRGDDGEGMLWIRVLLKLINDAHVFRAHHLSPTTVIWMGLLILLLILFFFSQYLFFSISHRPPKTHRTKKSNSEKNSHAVNYILCTLFILYTVGSIRTLHPCAQRVYGKHSCRTIASPFSIQFSAQMRAKRCSAPPFLPAAQLFRLASF